MMWVASAILVVSLSKRDWSCPTQATALDVLSRTRATSFRPWPSPRVGTVAETGH